MLCFYVTWNLVFSSNVVHFYLNLWISPIKWNVRNVWKLKFEFFLYNERLCGGGFDRVVVKYSRSHIQVIKKECKSVFISMNFISILCLKAAADCVVVITMWENFLWFTNWHKPLLNCSFAVKKVYILSSIFTT